MNSSDSTNDFKGQLTDKMNTLYKSGYSLREIKFEVEVELMNAVLNYKGIAMTPNVFVTTVSGYINLRGDSFFDELLLNGLYVPEVKQYHVNTDIVIQDGETQYQSSSISHGHRLPDIVINDSYRLYKKKGLVPESYKEKLLEILS